MIKATLLAAAALAAFATTAQASTIDVLLGASPSYSYSSSTTPANINLTNVANLSLSNALVASSNLSIPGYFSAPTGTIAGGSYLAVLGGGNATFSLANNGNSFGLTWGSIDAYNALTLTDTRGVSYTITGADVASFLSGVSSGATQANVVVDDPFARIVKIQLTSSSNSFEAANFIKSAAVPLPASAVLFAMALAGLAFFGRRKGAMTERA